MALRIVGGALGGRRLAGPRSKGTRATSERVREGIASALEARGAIAEARVLDLFAGTGALGFEALSRGAARALFVERDRRVARAITRSARELGITDRIKVVELDLLRDPAAAASHLARTAGTPYELVFVDPPYAEIERVPAVLDALIGQGVVGEQALVVLEHARRQPPASFGRLASVARYGYGDTAVVLAVPSSTEGTSS